MKRKNRFLALLMAMLMSVLTACGGLTPAPSAAPETVPDAASESTTSKTEAPKAPVSYTFGTASASGVHYAVGVLFSEALKKHSDYLTIFPQTTGGGEENGVNVANGEYEFGYWNCDSITAAYKGEGQLHFPNLRGVMTAQCQAAHYVVRNDSGIETWADCAGKKIGIATTNTVSEMITRGILAQYDIDCDADLARFEILANDEAREKLTDGDLDMIYIGGGFPVSGIIELMTTGKYHLLDTPRETLDAVFAAGFGDFSFEYYGAYVIGADTYPNQPQDITVAGGRNLIFTRDDVPEDDVYELLKVVYENWDEIKTGHLALTNLDWKEMPKTGVPLHPGAERFYREMGLLPSLESGETSQ